MSDVTGGSPEPLGVTLIGDGVNIAIFSAHASAIQLCLFEDEWETRRITLPERTGDVFHGHVAGIRPGQRYGLRAHGAYAPTEGMRFNPAKLLLDPHATLIDRPFRLHPSMFGAQTDGSMDHQDSAAAMPKAIIPGAIIEAAPKSFVPWSATVLYELHARGYSMRNEAIPAALRGTFAGLGHPASIDHLARLGVTAVEIMPATAWVEERHLAALGLPNYWGYNPIGLLAPDPRLAPGGWAEIRATVEALAAAGIETILDVVLNHTGEGDALGPTLSLRGLDNASYYRLRPDDPAGYIDDTGCGNTLALDRPPVLRLAIDSLRAWARLGGVHGFRFDLATTMGRRAEGFDPAAPLVQGIEQDPLLRGLKLIAEPWDIGPGGYQLGRFGAAWGEWNDRFRDDARRFWRGDGGMTGALATRLAGSSDAFAAKRRPSRGVNFITAHDGFTLADLVSHERKHNEANAENNRDGTDANHSWNHGVEGATDDPAIQARRLGDQRALLATLLLARGTPMLSMGSEFGHGQGGNNNAYAQDNETVWLDWATADEGLARWVARLTALRRDHPAFTEDSFLTGASAQGALLPDVVWWHPDGRPMADGDWHDADALGMLLATPGAEKRVCLILNRGGSRAFSWPEPIEGFAWRVLADSASPEASACDVEGPLTISDRSVVVLIEASVGVGKPRGGVSPALDRLAAAGIAGDWHEIDGTRHAVSPDTKRAILAALGLPAGTEGEARDALAHFADERERRPLPFALTSLGEAFPTIVLPLEASLTPSPVPLVITLESGETRRIIVPPTVGAFEEVRAADGRPLRLWRAPLPHLPIGRHRIEREDAPGVACLATIAPGACHLPREIDRGGRRFGLGAQLYALRRDGDQGIGDFATLGLLGERAAQAGAAMVAINPMHALFAGARDRASPYQPSDRRFLDPIYLDLPGAPTDLSALQAVDYPAVWALKSALLEARFKTFDRGDPAFGAFVAAGGAALVRFALYEAIAETRGIEPWTAWPDGLADCTSTSAARFAETHAERLAYHQFLQFLAERQFAEAAARASVAGLGLGFMRDLAVGAAPDGAEVWANPTAYARGASIGAPPDPFSPLGQNWGLAPPNPLAAARDGFASLAELLRANMRQAGGLRIDHVMGLARLFWVPEGADGKDGAYVAYPLKDLLAQVTLESARARCFVVGEDLGTVPNGLRESLAAADLLAYRVLFLEREGVGFKRAGDFPTRALACVTTHDLPTFTGWTAGADIAEQEYLGLIDAMAADDARARRAEEKRALNDALLAEGVEAAGDPMVAAHEFVARSPAALVLAQLDDLAGEPTAVNLPGTDRERPNWRRKLGPALPDLLESEAARAILMRLKRTRP